MRWRTAVNQAFQRRARIDAEALAPIARAETPTQQQAPAGVERPHELRFPGAPMRRAETRTAHARGFEFGDGRVGVTLAFGDVDVVTDSLAPSYSIS